MDYLEALALLHRTLAPANYCEIGCRLGGSLALAAAPSVGIDPDFEIRTALKAPTRLFRMTSDDFFAQKDVAAILEQPIDFAFIDGMHLVEYALRDFMNLERHASPGAVIALDDVLPQEMVHAARTRATQVWTGDVYRLVPILRHYRPDLAIKVYDIELKGMTIISRLDPDSTVLSDHYGKIVAEIASGAWSCASPGEIRRELKPCAVDQLRGDVADLAVRRHSRGPSGKQGGTERYLDLMKRSINNHIYLDDELRILYLKNCIAGRDQFDPSVLHDIRNARRPDFERLQAAREVGRFVDRDIRNCGFSHSMIGRKRLDNLHECLEIIRLQGIPGALVECGVWRGGACIFMAAYLRAHGMRDRELIAADSFNGLPAPRLNQDRGLRLSKDKYPELAVSQSVVRENFSVYGLNPDDVVFLEGWFKDTLPKAPISQIALLRMDGDLYQSTMDILDSLYDRVVPDGVVIVDDYHTIPACKQAIADFFARRRLPLPRLIDIDLEGAWFRKPL